MASVWPELALPCAALPGVGPARQRQLAAAGLTTIEDLLRHLPRRYEDRTVLTPPEGIVAPGQYTLVAAVGRVWTHRAGGRWILRATLGAGAPPLTAVWFNQPHLARVVRPGAQLLLSGSVVRDRAGRLVLRGPEARPSTPDAQAPGWVPVYRCPGGLPGHVLRRAVASAARQYAERIPDPLPPASGGPPDLLPAAVAWRELHLPTDGARLEAARRTVVFHELVALQVALHQRRGRRRPVLARSGVVEAQARLARFCECLPFTPTDAQRRVIAEIAADLAAPQAMWRLLQGDVGSGKTVVAAAAATWAAATGGQVAMMVPSQVLAEQHRGTLAELCGPLCAVHLLTAATPEGTRAELARRLAAGEPLLVVGTQSLLSGDLPLPRLGLAIIDEEHRFGVAQRAQLAERAADVLVMTATPIPRTLVQTLYGDMDISLLDAQPPGRRPVRTFVRPPLARRAVYGFLREQVRAGRQAFVICPRIHDEDGEGDLEAEAEAGSTGEGPGRASAEAWAQRLRRLLPPEQVGLLHGGLSPTQRAATMARFARGELGVLVATTVVEVGVDVPNATMIVVEDADRFGLAQLHQLRGRVGRGPHGGYCVLIADDPRGRLAALERLSDGFAIAQADLAERGPGEVLGTRQHGLPGLALAQVGRDDDLWRLAAEVARRLVSADPQLAQPAHQALRALVAGWVDGGAPGALG